MEAREDQPGCGEGNVKAPTENRCTPDPIGRQREERPGLYREVLFDLVDGRAATPLFQALSHERTARARLQALSVGAEVVAVLIDYVGPAPAVQRLRDVVQGRGEMPTVLHFDRLVDEEKRLRFVATWRRPPHPSQGVSLEHLLYDHVGPAGLLFGRVESGVISYKAASPGGRGLNEFLDAAQRAFGARFTIRPLRTGPFNAGWEIEDAPRHVEPEDEALLSVALASGYYDDPKRCGVRELGDVLGVSKSVVARRLRNLERRAMERLVG